MPKYLDIATSIERRVRAGDYAMNHLPSERVLAGEMGVSHMTARRAVQHLLDVGLLARRQNGRLDINQDTEKEKSSGVAALLLPDWDNTALNIWRRELAEVAGVEGMNIRPIIYQHIDDPVIFDTLSGDFSLIFISISRVTPALERRLSQLTDRVVTFFINLTHMGIRLIDGAHCRVVSSLTEHLYSLGHRRMAFFNFEPDNSVIAERKQCWEEAIAALGLSAPSYCMAGEPFCDTRARAYEYTKKMLKKGKPEFSAAFTTTVGTAQGMIRALYEEGYDVGRDISICSFGEYRNARWSIPSITVVDADGYEKLFKELFKDFSSAKGWLSDRMEYRLEGVRLYCGESTGSYNGG